MPITVNDGGVLRTLGEISVNDGGALRKLSTIHANDGGVLRQIFSASQPVSELNVGDKVKLRTTTGGAYSFIVVHKGKPSSIYDDSCDGIWLVKETPYGSKGPWTSVRPVTNSYLDSDVRYDASRLYYEIDAAVRPAINQARVPYYKTAYSLGGRGTLQSGSNGDPCRFFVLSFAEVGNSSSSDGARLSYFYNNTNRKLYYGGNGVRWWTRTPAPTSYDEEWYVQIVSETGNFMVNAYCGSDVDSTNYKYNRPACVLSYSAGVDKNGYITV